MLIETAHATINLDVNLAATIMVGVAGGMIIHYAFVTGIEMMSALLRSSLSKIGYALFGVNNSTVNGRSVEMYACAIKSEPHVTHEK